MERGRADASTPSNAAPPEYYPDCRGFYCKCINEDARARNDEELAVVTRVTEMGRVVLLMMMMYGARRTANNEVTLDEKPIHPV